MRCFLLLSVLSCLSLTSVARAQTGERAPWSDEVVELFATLPVQDGGRVKPLDTYAGFRLLRLNGKRSFRTEDGEKVDRTRWLLDCLFFPERARAYRTFLVRDQALLEAIGVDAGGMSGVAGGRLEARFIDDEGAVRDQFTIRKNAAPQVSLTSPAGAEGWVAGTRRWIHWTATDDVGVTAIDVDWSADGGVTWKRVASGLPNSGAYAWITPVQAVARNRLRVTVHDGDGATAVAATAADFAILASPAPPASRAATRGPYLQRSTGGGMTVRWRTRDAQVGRVLYGTSLPLLSGAVDERAATVEHEVTISDLPAGTGCYYAVAATAGLVAGGDATCHFVTPPGGTGPIRVWVIGNSGTADSRAKGVHDGFAKYAAGNPADLWLMLGDNAYDSGTDAEYQRAVFDTYPDVLRQSVLWPTRGNHDDSSSTYYGIFTLPRSGEAGGMPSGTEAYYSFDHANVHFVCLDSFASWPFPGGAMHRWLESDLASTGQDWIVAFWHHPPYSKGSHDSDSESRLEEMRRNALPILEQEGVDLVLALPVEHVAGEEELHEVRDRRDGLVSIRSRVAQGDGDLLGDAGERLGLVEVRRHHRRQREEERHERLHRIVHMHEVATGLQIAHAQHRLLLAGTDGGERGLTETLDRIRRFPGVIRALPAPVSGATVVLGDEAA